MRAAALRAAAAALIAGVMIWMNHLTPLFADDFSYSVSFVTKAPCESFWDVLSSQYLHYFTTNGRTVVHILGQCLLWLGKPGLNILNGLAFAGVCYLICLHALGKAERVRSWHLLSVFAALWFLTPHFGGSYLWVMGAVNYLYSPGMLLLYLLRWRNALDDEVTDKKPESLWDTLLWTVAGILTGWSNENTSLALICMVLWVMALRRIHRRRIFRWMWGGLAGNLLGCVLLFASPAQSKRLASAGGFGTVRQWLVRFVSISKQAVIYFYPLLLLALIVLLLLWKNRKWNPQALEIPSVYALGTLVSLYSMVGSPEFPVWAWSSILFLGMTTVFSLLSLLHMEKKKSSGRACAALGLIAVLAVGWQLSTIYPELSRVQEAYAQREVQIEQARQTGQPLVVEPIQTDCTYSSYSLFSELNPNGTDWPNNAIANYYGIASISPNPMQ